jgi:2'-phosphotransferase
VLKFWIGFKVCVHGTYTKFMDQIWEQGLKRMNRNHIHFATGLPEEDGVISGMRGSADILIYLDVEKALKGKLFCMPR